MLRIPFVEGNLNLWEGVPESVGGRYAWQRPEDGEGNAPPPGIKIGATGIPPPASKLKATEVEEGSSPLVSKSGSRR